MGNLTAVTLTPATLALGMGGVTDVAIVQPAP
jgi:hypothetical protein